MRSRGVSWALVLTTLLVGPALADDKAAEAQFKKGKKLLAEKRYADACAAFEKSNEIEPGIGAKLNVAKCYEEWGKLATALHWYRDAETTATQQHDSRLAKIHERAEEVDGDTPRLTLRTSKDADKTSPVTLDGAPAKLDEAFEVDPGAHLIEYTAENGDRKKKVVPVERGSTSEVKLDLPKHKAAKPVDGDKNGNGDKNGDKNGNEEKHPPPPIVPEDDPGRIRRLLGIGVGGAGVVGLTVAGALTLSAHGTYHDALTSHCGGSTTGCDPEGLKITHDARHRANIGTVFFSFGAAAIAGGVVLYLTAPQKRAATEHAFYLAPSVDDRSGGIVFGGRY